MKYSEETETERLKQILFPRKTATSRLITKQMSLVTLKQNQETNRHINHIYNIKQQIAKLKHGIQTFMEKQPSTDNILITPRECLELIRCMSDGMVNYREEIEQAIGTLIQSIPKPMVKLMPNTKYFLNQLKFGYFINICQTLRKRTISHSFQTIKTTSNHIQSKAQKQKQILQFCLHRLSLLRRNKLYLGLNRWRINYYNIRKLELEQFYYQNNLVQSIKQIQVIADESRLVVYLQKMLSDCSTADLIQILLYDSKNSALRGYKLQASAQNIGSAFQSVRNQSQLSNINTNRNEYNNQSMQYIDGRIKRLQLVLEHSLTKICISRRQPIAVQQMRKDQDYSNIDDYTLFHGLSARENMGACVFTPIVYKTGCIGVIRQYYYGKIGQKIAGQAVDMIGQVLNNSIKASNIFQHTKQKSLAIRNRHYLKSILLINKIQKLQQFSPQQTQKIYELIGQFYSLKLISCHNFRMVSNINTIPHFTITAQLDSTYNTMKSRQNIINTTVCSDKLTNVVVALNKMSENKSNYFYQRNSLYIRVYENIYTFQIGTNHGYGDNDDDRHRQFTYVSVEIISKILQKLQNARQNKQKQHYNKIKQQQIKQKQQQIRKQTQKNNKMLQFCKNANKMQNQQQLVSTIQNYMKQFAQDIKIQQIKVVPSSKFCHIKQKDNKLVLFANQYITVYCSAEQVGQNGKQCINMIDDNLKIPLTNLCSSIVDQINKSAVVANLRNLDLKQQIYYNVHDVEGSLTKMLQQIANVEDNDIFYAKLGQNPFVTKSYCCYLQRKYCDASNTSLLKYIKSQANFQLETLNPISTILCLDNQLQIIINKYLQIKQDDIQKLQKTYKKWKNNKICLEIQNKNNQNNFNVIKGVYKTNCIFMSKLSKIFQTIVKCKPKVKFMPNFLAVYSQRQNKKLVNFAFKMITECKNKDKKSKACILYCLIQQGYIKLSTSILRISKARQIFTQHKIQAKIQKSIYKMHKIYETNKNQILSSALSTFYLPKYDKRSNKLNILFQLFNKSTRISFQNLRRHSKALQLLSVVQDQTQCSIISKLCDINKIFKIVKQKYQNYEVYLYLKNGLYIGGVEDKVNVYQDISKKSNYQFYQFSSQMKSYMRNIVWLIPEKCTITLIQKHYLQVLSRAIQQGFQKFMYKNQQFIAILNTFFSLKTKQLLRKSLQNLRSHTLKKIKIEEYTLRDKFYSSSIQIQNYKLMQKQQRAQQHQRSAQIQQSIAIKSAHEKNLSQHRHAIIRLELSSRNLQQLEIKQKYQNQRNQAIRLFNLWRIQAIYRKKYAKRRQLARKRYVGGIRTIDKLLKIKEKQNIQYSMKRIMIQSANIKARNLSAQKQKKTFQVKDSTSNLNRLLTFQDELNQFVPLQEQELNSSKRDISIIPISFKHFEGSKKQNYDVTEQQMKKMNDGAYKLNAKTLKFLKRMGKLNN